LAPSTIPGAGLGVFAGREFRQDEPFLSSGDLIIPILHSELDQGDRKFLWREYTWDARSLFMDGEALEVSGASPGFGAAPNSIMDLVNANELLPDFDYAGLHRSRDPGAGAFTAYHNRQTIAYGTVEAGDELLVDYGDDWFLSREAELGPIPIESDIDAGEDLLDKFWDLRERMEGTEFVSLALLQDVWETFVVRSPFRETSRVLNAFPDSWNETEELLYEGGLKETRWKDRRRSMSWLHSHGTCADNMEARPSTIRQAGRGAFAARFLPEGSVVAPVPLIHLPDRSILDMTQRTAHDKIVGKQLLLNYCMGHSKSSVLLCPYGIHTSFVNHNQTLANVRLRWADPVRSNHQADWLDLTVDEIDQMDTAGLAMELVATRDIDPGEEIFLDYGQEWEDAWNRHLNTWEPQAGMEKRRGADEMNNDKAILRTVFDEITNPYPSEVELKCVAEYARTDFWQELYPDNLDKFLWKSVDGLIPCDLTNWVVDDEGQVFYIAVIRDESFARTRLDWLPREAFRFVARPYTSEMHLPNAFRHEMMIPDELFPEKWKNLEDDTTPLQASIADESHTEGFYNRLLEHLSFES
jgi:hypothetical protein